MKKAGKELLEIGIRKCCAILYRGMWVLPVKPGRIFFQSYEKAIGYCGNPKYLCEFLRAQEAGYELVYAIGKGVIPPEIPGVRFVRLYSRAWLKSVATAGTIIMNVRAPLFLSRRKRQLTINTWHAGGAYKRIGIAGADAGNEKILALSNERNRRYFNLFLSSSEKFTETNILEAFRYDGRILQSGMPRNDLFFDRERVKEANRKIRQEYRLKEDDFAILIAPTFRAEGKEKNTGFAGFPMEILEKRIREKTGRRPVFLIRKHHRDTTAYRFGDNVLDVSGWADTQELLCAADLLVTDYSSVMWDYCLMKRPILLYVSDVKKYEAQDRGFYTPIRTWPGILCEGPEEMEKCLETLERTDFEKKDEEYLTRMGSFEQGTACAQVLEAIRAFHGTEP